MYMRICFLVKYTCLAFDYPYPKLLFTLTHTLIHTFTPYQHSGHGSHTNTHVHTL